MELERGAPRMKRPAKPLDGLGGTLEKQVVPVRSENELQTVLDLAVAVLKDRVNLPEATR